jgi:hypothetical protein
MFDIGESLDRGLARAQQRLHDAQSAVAEANAGHGGRSTDAAMAQTARAAIFSEALLSAIHSRLEEVKAVTR